MRYVDAYKVAFLAVGLIFATPTHGAAQSQAAPSTSEDEVSRWALEVAAGGGFAGVREVEIQVLPHMICDDVTPRTCIEAQGLANFVKNTKYAWRPTLSTGLVFRRRFRLEEDSLGIGIGGHFVFVTKGTDTTAAPAVAVHVGKPSAQLFFGFIWTPVDEVNLPSGTKNAVMPATVGPDSFFRESVGSIWPRTFFAGVVIGGVPVVRTGN